MTCGETDWSMHYRTFIRQCTNAYRDYYRWDSPFPSKGWEMHRLKRDFEIAAALYKGVRRRELLKKAIDDFI